MRYFQSFKVPPNKKLITYKGERVNSQLEKPRRDNLNQVPQVNITSDVTNQLTCSWSEMRAQCRFCDVPNKGA